MGESIAGLLPLGGLQRQHPKLLAHKQRTQSIAIYIIIILDVQHSCIPVFILFL